MVAWGVAEQMWGRHGGRCAVGKQEGRNGTGRAGRLGQRSNRQQGLVARQKAPQGGVWQKWLVGKVGQG